MSRLTKLEALGRLATYYPYADVKGMVANLDRATKVPLYYQVPTNGESEIMNVGGKTFVSGEMYQVPGEYAVLNTRTLTPSAIVSRHYEVTQHNEVFSNIIESFQRLGIADVAYIMENEGDVVRLQGIFPEHKLDDDTSGGIIPGFQFKNGYDGATAISGSFYGIRSVCLNGMISKRIIKDVNFKIRHLTDDPEIDKHMEAFIEGILSNIENIHQHIKAAMDEYVVFDDYDEFGKFVMPMVASKKITEKILSELPLSVSKYQLYNQITEFATHADIKRTQRDKILINAEGLLIE